MTIKQYFISGDFHLRGGTCVMNLQLTTDHWAYVSGLNSNYRGFRCVQVPTMAARKPTPFGPVTPHRIWGGSSDTPEFQFLPCNAVQFIPCHTGLLPFHGRGIGFRCVAVPVSYTRLYGSSFRSVSSYRDPTLFASWLYTMDRDNFGFRVVRNDYNACFETTPRPYQTPDFATLNPRFCSR